MSRQNGGMYLPAHGRLHGNHLRRGIRLGAYCFEQFDQQIRIHRLVQHRATRELRGVDFL